MHNKNRTSRTTKTKRKTHMLKSPPSSTKIYIRAKIVPTKLWGQVLLLEQKVSERQTTALENRPVPYQNLPQPMTKQVTLELQPRVTVHHQTPKVIM
jgi:hypothetical protein